VFVGPNYQILYLEERKAKVDGYGQWRVKDRTSGWVVTVE